MKTIHEIEGGLDFSVWRRDFARYPFQLAGKMGLHRKA